MYKEGEGNARLYIDENEQYFVQKNIGSQLEKVDSREELAEFAQKDKEERKESLEKLKNSYKLYEYYPVDNFYPIKKYLGTAKDKIRIEKDGIWHVDDAQSNESFWVDPLTHRKHYTRPVLFQAWLSEHLEGRRLVLCEKHPWTHEQTIKAMGNCGR